MENTKTTSAVEAMLAQYSSNNKPKYEKKEKVYDLKNYFSTFLPEGVESLIKEIRILPTKDNSTPFVEVHTHKAQVDGEWKTYACLQHEKNQPCPFCEARQALLSTGEVKDKELAKKYNSRLMYVVKVIDRNKEGEGVKFWRFGHDYRKGGIYDKIHGVLMALKKDRDITNVTNGRDLTLTVSRDQNGNSTVSAVVAQDASPLSTDETKVKSWLADTRTWEDVYSVKTYDFLEIVVKGGIPVWDKEAKKFADKASLEAKNEVNKSEGEITLGVENVKSNIKTSNTSAVIAEEESDDLPF